MSKPVIPCSSLIALANGAELLRQQIGIDLRVTPQEIGLDEVTFRLNLVKGARIFLNTFESFSDKISEPLTTEEIEEAQAILHKLVLELTMINESLRCKLGNM